MTSFATENEYIALIVDSDENVIDVLGFDSAPNFKTKRKMNADCRAIIHDPANETHHVAWSLHTRSYVTEEELARGVRATAQLARALAAREQRGE